MARTLPGRRGGERDIARWAFADKATADEFVGKFGAPRSVVSALPEKKARQ